MGPSRPSCDYSSQAQRARSWDGGLCLPGLGCVWLAWGGGEDTGRGRSWPSWHLLAGRVKEPQNSHKDTRNSLPRTGEGGWGTSLHPHQASGTSSPSFFCILRVQDVNTGLCRHPPNRPTSRDTRALLFTLCREHTGVPWRAFLGPHVPQDPRTRPGTIGQSEDADLGGGSNSAV